MSRRRRTKIWDRPETDNQEKKNEKKKKKKEKNRRNTRRRKRKTLLLWCELYVMKVENKYIFICTLAAEVSFPNLIQLELIT